MTSGIFSDIDLSKFDQPETPSWIKKENSNPHKAWKAINELKKEKLEKIKAIKDFNNLERKPYQISKKEVCDWIKTGATPQNLFGAKKTSYHIPLNTYFDSINTELEDELKKRSDKKMKQTGLRNMKKDELIQKVKELEAKLQSEVLKDAQKYENLALSQIPLDLKSRMGLDREALALSKNKVTELKRKK